MVLAPLVWVVLAQTPTTPLTGTVVGPGGKAVVGAELFLMGLPSFDPPIVARGKSGEGGRFTLDRPTALAGDHDPLRAVVLWAVKPGLSFAVTRFPEALPKPDQPIRIVMPPSGQAKIRVEGPDGRPLGGVRVLPERLKTPYTNVPNEVAELAAVTTGPDGLAVVDAVTPEELAYVDIHSREFGIQGRPIFPVPGKPTVIALRPVATWKGRLVAEDSAQARGWRVRAWSRVGGGLHEDPQTTGYVVTTTDDQGRFTLDPIAVGGLELDLKPPGSLPVVADQPPSYSVREGRNDEVEIPLKKTVAVTGLFLERGTGKPVPGVSVTLSSLASNRNQSQTVETDQQGRYTLQGLPGRVRVGFFRLPKTHVQSPGQGWEDLTIPEGSKAIELATREALAAAPPLRGQVVDETGQGVPGALIQASWMLAGARGSSDGSNQVKTDGQGGFVLEGLGPDSSVTITARLHDRRTKAPLKVQAGEPNPVKVTITPVPMLAVAGRLLESGGAPLAGIPVRLQFRVPREDGVSRIEPARFEENQEIRTGADGTFLTPKELERKPSEFRVEVIAPGFAAARSDWAPVPEGDLLTLPDLTLKRVRGVRVVTGRVIDRAGEPVSGASVSQAGDGPIWTSTRTDAEGRYRLGGVASGSALVFATAPDFRFGGAIIGTGSGVGAGADSVEIRLARVNEPPIATLKTLPSPLSRAEERALARELLEPLLPQARAGMLGILNPSVFPILARISPNQIIDMVEDRVIDQPNLSLLQAVLGQFEDDPALAIATIGDYLDPHARAVAWLALEAFRPAPDRARREQFLERALEDARRTVPIESRVKLLRQIADRWLELGSVERARPILLEGQKLVDTEPKDRWSSEGERFAESLAAIDLSAAVALFERRGRTNVTPVDAATLHRHNAEAAIRLARLDPGEAERLIAPASASFDSRQGAILNVARRMGTVDLAGARRLLATIDQKPGEDQGPATALEPFGLGLIAAEMAASNPARARGLLDEAFDRLRETAEKGRVGFGNTSVANLMAELLPVVERLEPERLAERIWMLAASRVPSVREPNSHDVEATMALAMLVARYDREIADVIAAPVLERLPDLLTGSINLADSNLTTIFNELTVYDPRAIVPLIRSLPDAARKPSARADPWSAATCEARLRLAAASILGFPQAARPREAGRIGDGYSPYRLGE